ncbi:MAG: PilN domain-containing protein, partial [Candidatus Zixiibacteriota bacterium]
MIEINLLPKELRRKGRRFAFDKNLIYVGTVAVILVIFFVAVSIFQSFELKSLDKKIAEANKRKEELRKTIELVDALSDLKDKILQRMSAIETLDRNRATWVYILEDLSQRVPDYLWLSVFREQETVSESQAGEATASTRMASPLPSTKKVNIEGHTYSINSLALFLIQLTRSDYFKNMELEFIKKSELKEQKTFSFGL